MQTVATTNAVPPLMSMISAFLTQFLLSMTVYLIIGRSSKLTSRLPIGCIRPRITRTILDVDDLITARAWESRFH
jgi:hypothetical protein